MSIVDLVGLKKRTSDNHYAGVCPGGVSIYGVCVSDAPGLTTLYYIDAENKARAAKGAPALTDAEKQEIQALSVALSQAKSIEEKLRLLDQYVAYGRDTARIEESLARRMEAAATFEEKYAETLRTAATQVSPSASPMGVSLPDPTMTGHVPAIQDTGREVRQSPAQTLTGQAAPWYTRPEILASGAAALLLLLS